MRFLGRSPQQEPSPPESRSDAAGGDDRFDALIRALPLGVIMLDGRMRLRFANRAAAAIFGFDRARAKHGHLIEAVPSIELERRAEAVLKGERAPGPLIVSPKRGNRSYAVTVFPLTDEDEETIGAVILAEDQTELLALERARQEFLSNVSHELRTPLSSIRLMLETVNESGEEDARRVFVPQALGEVDRLTALVQRLLDQARVQSGQLVLRIADVDLEQLALSILRSFEQQAAARNISLDLRLMRPAVVEGDADRLSQVFLNLIDNAMRYTSEGGSITVEIDAQGGYAILRVSDTGIGIPYKDLPHIFERFYVVDRSRTRGAAGVGLGLSIVKDIVEAHKGSVSATSTLGSGALFTVRLPVLFEAANA